MHKALPIEVVHMSLGTSAHKSGCDHWATIEAPFVVESFAMDQSAGSFALLASSHLLDNEPFWKPPDPYSFVGLSWVVLHGWRGIQPRSRNVRHDLEFAREPWL
jgi:hypothetical protein